MIFTGQNFAHHQPRNWPEADGKPDDEKHKTGQWQPSVLRHVVTVVFVVEKRSESDERDRHCSAGRVQKDFATELVDETSCYESGQEIDDTHDDGAQVFVDGTSGFLNNNNEKKPIEIFRYEK